MLYFWRHLNTISRHQQRYNVNIWHEVYSTDA